MFLRLLFLLTVIPFLEIYFLIRISNNIGFGNTLLIVIVTGVAGSWLLKKQGHSIFMEVQRASAQGQIPSDAIAKGFLTFVGGVLLLTPGILTDAIGFSLIFPVTQILWKKYFVGQWERGVKNGSVRFHANIHSQSGNPFRGADQNPFEHQNHGQRRFDPDVIDIKAQSETVEKKDS